ncbi:MAG TPA: ubiquinol-cytochrome c reductase iron-sulfur subunit [Acidobacteriaceae bacterium]
MDQPGKTQIIDPKRNIVVSRRSFFGALLCVGAAGMGAILAVPVLRYILYPLYAKSTKDTWSPIGDAVAFSNLSQPILAPLDLKQVDGWREIDSSQTVYVTKDPQGQLGVLSSICPHMGCTIAWHQNQSEFYCPCHGSIFKPDGTHVSGPSPRGLDPLPHKIEDGKLLVKFQYFRENVTNQEVLS